MHRVHAEKFLKMTGGLMHIARKVQLFGGGLIGEKGAIALPVQLRKQEKYKYWENKFSYHKGASINSFKS
jgi:hypothetical protein